MRVATAMKVNLRTLGFEYLGDQTEEHGFKLHSALGHGRVVRGLSMMFLMRECIKVARRSEDCPQEYRLQAS